MTLKKRPSTAFAGEAVAAKWSQTSTSNGGSAQITWIPLNPEGGDVDESIVAQALAGKTFNATKARFEDLFDYLEPTYQAGTNTPNSPPAGYKSVVTEADGIHEWLRLRPGKGPLASLLETRRMAAYVGATVEFSKFEGMAFDPQSNSLFIASTTVDRSMLSNPNVQGSYDAGGPNDVRLEKVPGGVVYRLNLQYNGEIGSNYVAADIYPELISPPAAFNPANGEISPDEICNPDNIDIDVAGRMLYISEDGDGHPNNYLWAHNLITKEKKRIYAATPDAEVTSGYYFPNVGGHSYLTATSQGIYPAYVGYWTFPKDS